MRDQRAEAVFFGVGGVIILIINILLLVVTFGTRVYVCDYEVSIDDQTTEESDIYLKWVFGKLTTAKAKLSYNTAEHITDEQSASFKDKINNSGYYSSIEWQDFWSYKVVAEVEYDLTKTDESLGGTSYEEITDHLKQASNFTCEE